MGQNCKIIGSKRTEAILQATQEISQRIKTLVQNNLPDDIQAEDLTRWDLQLKGTKANLIINAEKEGWKKGSPRYRWSDIPMPVNRLCSIV